MANSQKNRVTGPSNTEPAPARSSAGAATGGVSLDVLCRRAERLIDSVRTMGERVDRMLRQPDLAVAEADDAAGRLTQLRDEIEAGLTEARRTQDACAARMEDLGRTLPAIQQTAEGLIRRVTRARELTDAFSRLIESGAGRIEAVESAAAESTRTRVAVDTALQELARVQSKAEQWAQSVGQLSVRQTEFLKNANTVAAKLRTLTDAGEDLRQSMRQDVVELREMLRESRLERLAWEKLLARMPVPPSASPTPASPAATSGPAALAERVSRLTGYIRSARNCSAATADAASLVPSVRRAAADSRPDGTPAEGVEGLASI